MGSGSLRVGDWMEGLTRSIIGPRPAFRCRVAEMAALGPGMHVGGATVFLQPGFGTYIWLGATEFDGTV